MMDGDPRTWHSVPGLGREHHKVFGTECPCGPTVTPMASGTDVVFMVEHHVRSVR